MKKLSGKIRWFLDIIKSHSDIIKNDMIGIRYGNSNITFTCNGKSICWLNPLKDRIRLFTILPARADPVLVDLKKKWCSANFGESEFLIENEIQLEKAVELVVKSCKCMQHERWDMEHKYMDVANKFGVGTLCGEVIINFPKSQMTTDEAQNLAVHLLAITDNLDKFGPLFKEISGYRIKIQGIDKHIEM